MSQLGFAYNSVCWTLMEDPPNGLVLGLLTFQEFLDYANLAILDLAKETAINQSIFAQSIFGGTSQYNVPDTLMRVDDCFIAGLWTDQSTISSITRELRAWSYEEGYPRYAHQDELPPQTLEILPAPNFNSAYLPGPNEPDPPHGQFGSFYATDNTDTLQSPVSGQFMNWVGPTLPAPLQMLSTIEGTLSQDTSYANDFSQTALVYKILWYIWSGDSELRDIGRAAFADQQYRMIVGLMKVYLSEPDQD